ncbi:UPF0764 protein C16orf89 homolog [Rhinatrema bivittatum]|uniref:UPF0764 protein C16orf89 homolog n=1 Tax=Rhinatrema bivittatum TaxID=194408 RepID=UPI00112B930F|nr:UPF0764 protein C16orf89 homolog [Rhinatrema bivittatum]
MTRQAAIESYIQFIDRLQEAIQRQVDNPEASAELIRKLAFENANADYRKALQSVVCKIDYTLADMLKACMDVGTHTFQMDALAAALHKDTMEQSEFGKLKSDSSATEEFLVDKRTMLGEIYPAQGIEALKNWPSKTELRYLQVKRLLRRLKTLITRTVPYVERDDPQYYKAFKKLLEVNFWTPSDSLNQTDPAWIQAFTEHTTYYMEDISDKCIQLILGTWEENGEPCAFNDTCRAVFLLGYSNYDLSHQLFWIMIAERMGCRISEEYGVNVEEYKKIFCSTMMEENKKTAENGYPENAHDIFAENILFCGMCGFSDFYNLTWLDTILSWQDPITGCFGEISMIHNLTESTKQEDHQHLRRVKRRERLLADGCMFHKTSVIAGALGGYLQHMAKSFPHITWKPHIFQRPQQKLGNGTRVTT